MRRWIWFLICAVLGLVLLVCGLLVPVHLRAVDSSILKLAGGKTPGLAERGLTLVSERKLGAAQLLLQAAKAERLPGWEKLDYAVDALGNEHPGWRLWGCPEPRFENIFETDPRRASTRAEPFTEYVIRLQNRGALVQLLEASPSPAVRELLRCRALTNTAIFPSSRSASGQAFDAAITVCGLLLDGGHLGLSNTVFALAQRAVREGDTLPLEQVLLDLMSLGQRFNWGQLVAFAGPIEDPETLRLLGTLARKAGEQLPMLFSAVEISGKPAAVARYMMDFSQSGLADVGASLRFGAGGINELLRRDQRVYVSRSRERVATMGPLAAFCSVARDYCWREPSVAQAVKWFLYLASGFLFAAAAHFARRAVSLLERPLQVRGFHVAREILFAMGFLVVVLLLSEPFLSQESQRVEFPFRVRLPTVSSAVPAAVTRANSSIMNQLSLLTLLLFFVLQGLLYTACLFKLAEIRRQKVPARMKLKLLENEDHLFDAGLYLGFAGTIISLILVSLGIIKPSLMAAYSSTSFGIIFVSVFKIFHLRPARRTLLLEAEAASTEPVMPAARTTFAAST